MLTNPYAEPEFMKAVRKAEAPQNYNLKQAKMLEKKDISPFKIRDKWGEVNPDMLVRMLNFVIPFRYTHEWTGPSGGMDED